MPNFPYSHLPEPPSWFLRARAEGRVQEMGLADKLAYVWKYLGKPKLSAPEDCLQHFANQKTILAQLAPPPAGATNLGFLGDIMWIRKGWKEFLSPSTLAELRSLDGVVGNLESVVSQRLPVREFLPDYFVYNSDPSLVTSFSKEDGESLFAALSFANNHALDHGDDPALDTLAFLDSLKIPHSGLKKKGESKKNWVEFERGGIRFGFYAASFGLNDNRLLEDSKVKLNWIPGLVPERVGHTPDLSEATLALMEMEEEKIDIKIIFLHWGFEFEIYPSPRCQQVARALVEAGADLLVGSHPHVAQPAEVFFVNGYEELSAKDLKGANLLKDSCGRPRKALALYSLGNFASAMYTFLCRVALLKEVGFFRLPNGRVDWGRPRSKLFYNFDNKGGRKILTMEELAQTSLVQKRRFRAELLQLLEHLGDRELNDKVNSVLKIARP